MDNRAKSNLVENPNEHFYTLEEVAQHKSEDDCWTILNGRIYDVT
jgi:cytochrome b involved in lipid metabolism